MFMPGLISAATLGQSAFSSFPEVIEASASGGAATNHSISITTPASGDLLFLIYTKYASAARTISTPSGWTSLYSNETNGTLRSASAFYRFSNGTESSISIVASGNGQYSHAYYRLRGGASIEVSSVATGANANPNPPSLAPSWGSAKTLWIAVSQSDPGDDASSLPSSYGNGISASGGPGSFARTVSCHRELEAASEDPSSFTLGASASWVAATIAVQPQ